MKILIAEDDPVSRRLLEAFLTDWGYEVECTGDGMEGWEILQRPEAPNFVISDWMMPHVDGLALCRRIREVQRSPYTYFIILTSKGGKEDIVEGLEAGADDFLTKPFDREELRCRVKIGERIISLERRISQMAATDYLTGLLNRRAFMERMEEELQRSLRHGKPFSLIMADIDHFKQVNDTYGHQAGDAVIRTFAERLSRSSRKYDFTGRYGGEEFVVCLPETDVEQCVAVAERIRRSVEEGVVNGPDGSLEIKLSASFGVTASNGDASEETLDRIIKRADDALYTAKREGRNRVHAIAPGGRSSHSSNRPDSDVRGT